MGPTSIWHYIDTIYATSASLARASKAERHVVASRKADFIAALHVILTRSCPPISVGHSRAPTGDSSRLCSAAQAGGQHQLLSISDEPRSVTVQAFPKATVSSSVLLSEAEIQYTLPICHDKDFDSSDALQIPARNLTYDDSSLPLAPLKFNLKRLRLAALMLAVRRFPAPTRSCAILSRGRHRGSTSRWQARPAQPMRVALMLSLAVHSRSRNRKV
jgi:hypothetical protein